MSFCYGYGGVVPIKTNWAGEGQSVSLGCENSRISFEETVRRKTVGAGENALDCKKYHRALAQTHKLTGLHGQEALDEKVAILQIKGVVVRLADHIAACALKYGEGTVG